jgi:hypothetical protein
MKKTALLFIAFTATLLLKAAVIKDTVTVGAQYANQIWYSLPNGSVATAPKDDWDIAFQISGYAASILANTQKGLSVYQSPFAASDWATVDTAGITGWNVLHNSDTSWDYGALSSFPDGNFDLGWGIYDLNTHQVTGDSVFIIKLANGGAWKKLKMDGLISGIYTFTWADLNGSNEQSGSVAKSNYTGKRFAYFSLANNTALDREPAANTWDLTFSKYITTLYAPAPTPYGVTGLLQNSNTTAIKAYPVNDLAANDYNNYQFQTQINTIGYDWKKYNSNTSLYDIEDSTVYFVKRSNGDIWKITFLEFGGSATGNYIFNKELLFTTAVGINDNSNETLSTLSLYPNPAHNRINLIYNLNGSDQQTTPLQIRDAAGHIIMEQNILIQLGLQQTGIDISALQSGVYLVSLPAFGNKTTRFIVQ